MIEDISASLPITIFAKTYAEYKHLLTANVPVILTGKISEREDRDTEIICQRVEVIPETAAELSLPKKQFKSGLYIKIPSIEHPDFQKVKRVLCKFKGDCPVIIYCTENSRKLEAKELRISPCEALITELSEILGDKKVFPVFYCNRKNNDCLVVTCEKATGKIVAVTYFNDAKKVTERLQPSR